MRGIYSVVLFFSFLVLAACEPSTPTNAQGNGKTKSEVLNVEEYEKKITTTPGTQLVDVRTADEYAEGHLPNAVNIDYNADDFEANISKLDKTKPVFVYCRSGRRSASAADDMGKLGFAEVYNMKGGIVEWESSGKTVTAKD